jgi:hypothetical protein
LLLLLLLLLLPHLLLLLLPLLLLLLKLLLPLLLLLLPLKLLLLPLLPLYCAIKSLVGAWFLPVRGVWRKRRHPASSSITRSIASDISSSSTEAPSKKRRLDWWRSLELLKILRRWRGWILCWVGLLPLLLLSSNQN